MSLVKTGQDWIMLAQVNVASEVIRFVLNLLQCWPVWKGALPVLILHPPYLPFVEHLGENNPEEPDLCTEPADADTATTEAVNGHIPLFSRLRPTVPEVLPNPQMPSLSSFKPIDNLLQPKQLQS